MVGLFWVGTHSLQAQDGWPTRLQDYLTIENQRIGFNGVCLVAKGGEVLYHKAFGTASFEYKIPMNTDHRFKIASISKSFTGLLMGLAIEEGKLKPDDTIGKYLPEFNKGYWTDVSLQHLLTHTSGLPHHEAIPDYWRVKSKLAQAESAILNDIKGLPFLFPPGTDVKYSSPAYYLLAKVLEKAYGKDYPALLQEKITQPLGLMGTGIYDPHQVIPHMATGYHLLTEDSLIVAPYRDFSPLEGAGSLYSNSTDLLKFNQSLLMAEPWSTSLLTDVLTPQSDHYMKKRPYAQYGYGWYSREAKGKHPRAVFHGGGTFGCSALSAIYPSEGLSIILLSNISTLPIDAIWQNVETLVLGLPFEMPTLVESIAIDEQQLQAYIGHFRSVPGQQDLAVFTQGNKLFAQLKGRPPFQLHPTGTHEFLGKKVDISFTFLADEKDQITKIEASGRGRAFSFQKID